MVLGEAALTPADRIYVKFADEFERTFVNQGFTENRSIEETLAIGWKLLAILPRAELKRVRAAFIEKYPGRRAAVSGGRGCRSRSTRTAWSC